MSANSKTSLAQNPRLSKAPRLDSLKKGIHRSAATQIPKPSSRQSQPQARRSTTQECTNAQCPGGEIVEDDGARFCGLCGTLIQETHLTSELNFGENAAGAAVVQGSYVGADSAYARSSGPINSRVAGGVDTREITLANGRRYVNQLATALRLPQNAMEGAMQFYKVAIANNFIQGRRTKNVAAICLYIACRRDEQNRTMLIDFADVLMVNVFKLGQTYKELLEALYLHDSNRWQVNPINPEALIERFANRLEFGDKTTVVKNEAVKILQRMDRDWMTPGRRPAGVCGAALILAARMNNFRRTIREVVYIVKVTDLTIHKRLDEFKVTGSSNLTVEQFRRNETSGDACDPPAFYQKFQSKKKRGKRKARDHDDEHQSDQESTAEGTSGSPVANDQLQTPAATQAQKDSQAMPPPPIPIDPALLEVSAQRLTELDASSGNDLPTPDTAIGPQPQKRRPGRLKGSKNKKPPTPSQSQLEDESSIESDITSLLSDPTTVSHANTLHQTLEPTDTTPIPQQTEQTEPHANKAPIPDSEIIPEEEFAGDPEVDDCLLTPAEIEIKERIWVHENSDYLRAQQAKMLKQQLAEANGTARVIRRRKRKRGRMGDMSAYRTGDDEGESIASTPAEATERMLQKRGYSRKINYEAVRNFFERSPSVAAEREIEHTSRRDSVAGSADGEAEEPGGPSLTITSPTPGPTDHNISTTQDEEDTNDDEIIEEIAGGGVLMNAIAHEMDEALEDDEDFVGAEDGGQDDGEDDQEEDDDMEEDQ